MVYDQDLIEAGYFHNSLISTFKVTFLPCDLYFQGHVFISVVICMLCIQHSARPLRLPAARCLVDFQLVWNPSLLSVTGNRFAALFRLSGHQLTFRIRATWSCFSKRHETVKRQSNDGIRLVRGCIDVTSQVPNCWCCEVCLQLMSVKAMDCGGNSRSWPLVNLTVIYIFL